MKPETKRLTAQQVWDARLKELQARQELGAWNHFVTEMKVPGELIPAMQSTRPELVRLVKPRALTEEEHALYLKIIETLLATNNALQAHAKDVSALAGQLRPQVKGLIGVMNRLEAFAAFRTLEEYEDEEEDQ